MSLTAIHRVPWAEAFCIAEMVAKRLAPHVERLKAVGSLRRRRDLVGDIEFLAEPRLVQADLFGTQVPDLDGVRAELRAIGTWVKGGERMMQVTDVQRAGLKLELYLTDPLRCSGCGKRPDAAAAPQPGMRADADLEDPANRPAAMARARADLRRACAGEGLPELGRPAAAAGDGPPPDLVALRCSCGRSEFTGTSWGSLLAIRTGPYELGREAVTRMRERGYRHEEGRVMKGSDVIATPDEESFYAAAGLPCRRPHERDEQAMQLEEARLRAIHRRQRA